MKRNNILVVGVIALMIMIGSFLALNFDDRSSKELENQTIKQMVSDYSTGHLKAKSASITSQQLIVTDHSEKKLTYSLPEDEFFVSIAPYIEGTHPCAIHSLTGCRGELANAEFEVYVEDNEGKLVLDQKMKSHPNGFIDLWLPRDQTYRISITKDGKSAVLELSTFEDDDTCISTMQLN